MDCFRPASRGRNGDNGDDAAGREDPRAVARAQESRLPLSILLLLGLTEESLFENNLRRLGSARSQDPHCENAFHVHSGTFPHRKETRLALDSDDQKLLVTRNSLQDLMHDAACGHGRR